jgi:hypothetical protein
MKIYKKKGNTTNESGGRSLTQKGGKSKAMYIIIAVLVAICVLGGMLLFMPFKIDVYGMAKCVMTDNNEVDADFDLFAVITFLKFVKIKLPFEKIKKIIINSKRKKNSSAAGRAPTFGATLTLHRFDVRGALGVGDSAGTALSVGAAYAALALPATLLLKNVNGKFAVFSADIQPEYEKIGLYAEVRGIFSGKVVNIILKSLKKGRQ